MLTGSTAWSQAPSHPSCWQPAAGEMTRIRLYGILFAVRSGRFVGIWLPLATDWSPEAIWMPAAKPLRWLWIQELCCECGFHIHRRRVLPGKVCFLKAGRFLTSARLTLNKPPGHNSLWLFWNPCFHSYLLATFTPLCLLLQTFMCLSFAVINARKAITIMYTVMVHLTINQKLRHPN